MPTANHSRSYLKQQSTNPAKRGPLSPTDKPRVLYPRRQWSANRKDVEQMMARYRAATGSQAESEPGSRGRVLRNKLAIRSKRQIDRAEYDALLRAQTEYLNLITADTRFTAVLLCQMHRDWLGSI